MNGFVIRYLRVYLTASIAGFTDVPEPFFFLLILLRLACSVCMWIRLWVCVFAYIPINACPMFIAYVWRGLSKAISIPPTAELVACVAPHHTHTLTWGSFPLVLTLKRIMLGCLIWTVISRCKAYYCIGFTQQAVQPPPEWSLSSRRHIRALRKWQLFQPLWPQASWHQEIPRL